MMTGLDDTILDNYVELWRHIMGDKRLRVQAKPRPTKPLHLKELWRQELRACKGCGIQFYPTYYGKKYCGHEFKGCCAQIRRIQGYHKGNELKFKYK